MNLPDTGSLPVSRVLLLGLCMLLLFGGMRAAFITADAPQDLSISGALYSDEGFKTYSSRNMALYGAWKWTSRDGYSGWLEKSPLPVHAYTALFRKFGTGFSTIRALPVVSSVLTMILLFFFAFRRFNSSTALLSLLFFGISFYNCMFNRLGFFEIIVNLFLMAAIFLFSEIPSSRSRSLRAAYILLGCAALVCADYSKQTWVLALLSALPALLICITVYSGKAKQAGKILPVILALIAIFYLFFAHISGAQELFDTLLKIKIGGHSLREFIHFRTNLFNPLHIVLGMGMYMEFIFLRPFIFLFSLLYSVYAFSRYIESERKDILELVLASWLLFGFILLSIMKYHPARYYLVLVIPSAIMLARALSGSEYDGFMDFITGGARGVYRVLVKIFLYIALACSGTVLAVQLIPFPLRARLKDLLYPAVLAGDIRRIIPVAAIIVLFEIACVTVLYLNRRRIATFVRTPGSRRIIILAIVLLQLFQYGKWAVPHDTTLRDLSRDLGRDLPADSIIMGSWSAGLTVENRLRPLILQDRSRYNHETADMLINNIPIPVVADRGTRMVPEKGAPLYFAVCPEVIFEKKIAENYNEFMNEKSLYRRVRLGYYTILIYRIR